MKANKVMISGKYRDDEWQQLLDGQGLFMFAEAAINEAVPGLAEKWGGSLEQTRLYWGETGKLHSTISPYLIPVHRQNWPELQRLVIHQPGWGLLLQLGWFMLAYTPLQQLQALLAHLRQWSWITTPENETAILRLSDWQVVKPLLTVSSPAEATALFGPVATIIDMSPDGGCEYLQLIERVEHDLAGHAPQQLSPAQWTALNSLSDSVAHDEYIEHIQAHHPVVKGWQSEQLFSFIKEGEQEAFAHGFKNQQDVIRFLSLKLEMPAGFMALPWAKKIMAEPAELIGQQSRMDRLFEQALCELDKG
ncbi:DUF4123 domain-containing protein [Aeromonas dhakensis]|uniref:DUF4123 domain-containing protein n=1 Tax=Aeromonas dhakensis TaxID=196024 RepID=UPI001118E07B|nr:DUF4123 domain-containing protein [Aeromonas dhakensis]TND60218.1 hypothetical protein CF129_01480 [Aeromonas dhakensis]CAB5694514.1 Uncharacterised protein [Aeromonas hydrophila]